MLGKLLKHEWKESWKIPVVLIGILWILAAMAGLTFISPMWQSELAGLNVLMVLVILAFYFSIIGVSIGIMLYMAIRFYKNMFTDEGYLTHTLPVSTHELLLSKIMVMSAWIFLSMAAIVVSLLIFGCLAAVFLMPEGHSFANLLKDLNRLVHEFILYLDKGVMSFIGSLLFLAVVSIISGTMMIVGSISIGQMVKKHKILGSVGAYFALSTVIQIVSTVVLIPLMFYWSRRYETYTSADNVFQIIAPMYLLIGILSLGISAGLYFLSEFLIRKKLNLD